MRYKIHKQVGAEQADVHIKTYIFFVMKNLLLEVRATNSVTIADRCARCRVATAGSLVVMATPRMCEVAQNTCTVALLLQGDPFRAAKIFGEKPVTLSTINSTRSGIEHGSPPREMGATSYI